MATEKESVVIETKVKGGKEAVANIEAIGKAAETAKAAVDRRADSDFGKCGHGWVG